MTVAAPGYIVTESMIGNLEDFILISYQCDRLHGGVEAYGTTNAF